MSEFPHTTAQFDPTQHSAPVEVTKEQMINASAEDIIAAANADAERIQLLLPTVEPGGRESVGLRDQLLTTGHVLTHARRYGRLAHLHKSENFGDFLATQMDDLQVADADDVDAFEGFQKADSWFLNQTSTNDGGAIGNILRKKQEQQSVLPEVKVQPEAEAMYDPQIEAGQKAQALEGARKSVESARGIELFDDIVTFSKNKTQLHTDVSGGFKNIGDGPEAGRTLARLPQPFTGAYKNDHKNIVDWRQELNETVVFSDVIEQDSRQVTRQQQQKGRFGRVHTTEVITTEAVPGSERPKLIRNEVTGQDESTVRFRYNFDLRSGSTSQGVRNGELPDYREFGGYRSGQVLHCSVDLPKSVADQLQQQVKKDPASVRTLVEKLSLSNNDGRLNQDDWFNGHEGFGNPIRPPYEKLPKDWNMAIVANQEGPGSISSNYDLKRVIV